MAVTGKQFFCGTKTATNSTKKVDICQVPANKRWVIEKLAWHYHAVTDGVNVTDVMVVITDDADNELKKLVWKISSFDAADNDTDFETVEAAEGLVLKDEQKLRLVTDGSSYSVTVHLVAGGAEIDE